MMGGGQGRVHSIAALRDRRKAARSLLNSRQHIRRENSSSEKLQPYPSSRALTRGSTRQPWIPAFCWRKRVTMSRNRKRGCSRRLWRQRWRRPGKRRAHRAGFGRDVAPLLSLLAAAIRQGQQQCHLPPGIRNQNLESFLVTPGQMHSFFPGPQVSATPCAQASQPTAPHNAVPASIPTTIPGIPGAAESRVDAGASSSGAVGFAHDPSGFQVARCSR